MTRYGESTPIARWTDFPFPSYTYIPGKSAHPVRDVDGHSFGRSEPVVDSFDSERWYQCSAYLFGLDLFNAGFFWESHEQWEAVWHAVGRTGPVADFLKGLIKLSAAGVKSLEGRPIGVLRHLRRAAELFDNPQALAVNVKPAEDVDLGGFKLSELSQKSRATAQEIESVTDRKSQCLRSFEQFRLTPTAVP